MSDAYYKMNLFCYNFAVYDFVNDLSIYVWQETTASHFSRTSCFIKHMKSQASGKNISAVFGNTCSGQNMGIKMSLFMMNETEP
jgi:hypothetical protein